MSTVPGSSGQPAAASSASGGSDANSNPTGTGSARPAVRTLATAAVFGQPIAGATIELLAPDGTSYRATADPDGNVVFENLPDGNYTAAVVDGPNAGLQAPSIVAVRGNVISRSAAIGSLAFTGSSTMLLAATAVGLIAFGAVLVGLQRRRKPIV